MSLLMHIDIFHKIKIFVAEKIVNLLSMMYKPLFVFCTLISSLISLRKLNNDLMSFTKTVQMIHKHFFFGVGSFQGKLDSGNFFQQIKSKNKIQIIT